MVVSGSNFDRILGMAHSDLRQVFKVCAKKTGCQTSPHELSIKLYGPVITLGLGDGNRDGQRSEISSESETQ